MARTKDVTVGSVWTDSKGRQLRVLTGQGSDKKYALQNLATKRTLRRGPGALKKLVSAKPTAARKPPARKKRKAAKNPTPVQDRTLAAISRAATAYNSPWPAYDMPPAFEPAQSPFYNPPEEHHGRRNPTHYPSALTRYVAESLAAMDPSQASDPAAVNMAVARALVEWRRRGR